MIIAMEIVMMTIMTTKVSIEPVERWEKGILALKIIDELTMWFFTIGDHEIKMIYHDFDHDDRERDHRI